MYFFRDVSLIMCQFPSNYCILRPAGREYNTISVYEKFDCIMMNFRRIDEKKIIHLLAFRSHLVDVS